MAVAMTLTGCGSDNEKINDGMQLIKQLDYQGALEAFEEAAARSENERLIERGRGIAYMGLTDYEQAILSFQSSLAKSDGLIQEMDFDVNYYMAAAYIKSECPKEAKDIYDAILALRPEEKDALFLRGSVLLALDDYEDAKQDFDKLRLLEPANYDRLVEIYQVLADSGYKEAGQEYLQDALTTGESKMNSYDKGRIYYYLGEYQKAYLALEDAREKGGAESYLYLGKAYEATGDYNYAASVYNNYLATNPQCAEIYNQLGLCEMARGNYEQALTALQNGMQVENCEIMQTLSFNEIVVYEYLGEYQKAAVLMDNYLKNYPDDEKAKREQIFLSTR
ncbi:MAG: tetratricopeptide repeat protein [Acetatifactor sp.]|nr:tetratricopeptide repeat protein [Acetatifactor sp.]